MTLSIQPLTSEADRERCARLMASSEPWVTLGRTYEASLAILRDPMRENWIAWRGKDLAGFLILVMTGAFVGYIQTVCVVAEMRGQGVGTDLVRFAEERIFRESPNVFMCVSSFNTGARKLYERLGYAVIGELTDYIVPGHSEILLRKTRGPLQGFEKHP
jgi:ribosomal protein S18 acetylase RimI-like enzyme